MSGVGNHTHAALLTPRGRGAVATVRVVGPAADLLVAQFFQPLSGRTFAEIPVRAIAVGNWVRGPDQHEELVVTRLDTTTIEIHSHGGYAASNSILADLESAGAIVTDRQWTLPVPTEPSLEMRAVQLLPDCSTVRTAAVVLDQSRGAFRRACEQIRTDCAGTAATRSRAVGALERLVELIEPGAHLTVPWRVVLAGPPNVGKSSLLNALLGYERTIVWDQPGTTRDIVSATTAFAGWPVEIADTAGLHHSNHTLEVAGMERTTRSAESADLVVIVADARALDDRPLQSLQDISNRSLLVANKADLLPPGIGLPDAWLPTSATCRSGLDALQTAIVAQLVPHPPAPGEAVPFLPACAAPLRAALHALRHKDLSETLHWLDRAANPTPAPSEDLRGRGNYGPCSPSGTDGAGRPN